MTRNALLIVVDALRADRVYYDNGLTPNLDSMAANGEQFDACYACADKTTASLTTIQTGQYPTRHGVLHLGYVFSSDEFRHYLVTGDQSGRYVPSARAN